MAESKKNKIKNLESALEAARNKINTLADKLEDRDRQTLCKACNGWGTVSGERCEACDGEGKRPRPAPGGDVT